MARGRAQVELVASARLSFLAVEVVVQQKLERGMRSVGKQEKLVNVVATGVAVLSVAVAHRIAAIALREVEQASEREKRAFDSKAHLENAVASGEYDAQFNTVLRDKEVDGSAFFSDKNLLYYVRLDLCRISGEAPMRFGLAENIAITNCTVFGSSLEAREGEDG